MAVNSTGPSDVKFATPISTPCSTAPKNVPTRQTSTIFGLGSKITAEDSTITGSRLPTSSQVLRCLMYHLADGSNCSRWEAAKAVLIKITVFYEKANIPMITERKACERMIKLLDDNAKVRAIPKSRRATQNSLNKVKQMEEKLSQTFPLWPAHAEQLIKNTEDLAFLESMKNDRLATFGSMDKVLAIKIQRREQRIRAETMRGEKMNNEPNVCRMEANCESSSSDESTNNDESDALATPRRIPDSQIRVARTGTTAFIPHDIIKRPKLVALATRLKMTPVQQAAYTKALISEAGGDTSKISASYATADKARRLVGKKIADSCKAQWVPPKLATCLTLMSWLRGLL